MIEKIKELKNTEKGPVIIKLCLYMVFFFAIIILSVVANRTASPRSLNKNSAEESKIIEKETKPDLELSFFEKQEKLYRGIYEFSYRISLQGKQISFDGTHKDGRIDGLKETDDELIKYTIEEGTIYRIKFDEKEEYPELYKDMDESLFDFKLLFSELNSTGTAIEKTDHGKVYKYQNFKGYDVIIETNRSEIENIKVSDDKSEYIFEFTF